MSNSSNLKPFRKGDKRASKAGKKGGSTKTIFTRLRSRKYCNKTCPYIDKCPFFEFSQKEEGRPCMLKKSDTAAQKRVRDILIKGQPEVIEEYKRIIARMGEAFDKTDSLKGMAIYADKVKDLQEMLFGKKPSKIELTGDIKTTITADDFKKAMKEMKE